ncbi:serine/threonine dehydratase [Williamsia soli]|uniref:serine/threonine dehydratase n=1 Tax=Williamsia soli TaxID=364929 RepID=UPI001A9D0828|nr:serine/threonine dehydratase [Williamsia soli]
MPSISVDEIVAARGRISSLIRPTPVLHAEVPTPSGPVPVALKLEYLQLGGSFKIRGSLNAILHAQEGGRLTDSGVVIASGGNAAIGAAMACRMLDLRCSVVVPTTAPAVKVARLNALGADVHQIGDRYALSAEAAALMAEQTGALQLHAYDLPDIVAGAGTIGLELREQLDVPLDVFVAVGGGGLVGGLVAALAPEHAVTGVEPVGASALHQALAAGRPVPVELDSVASDSLGATQLGALCWDTISALPIGSITVTDDELTAARNLLWDEFRIVVEHGTAAALAPLLSGAVEPEPGRLPCVILCGANTSVTP